MSYIEKKDEEQTEQEQNQKSKSLIKTIFAEDTIVEDPQDIIDKDPDIERRNAFKKVYEMLLALFPEEMGKKKKQKKSKEKEEFDKNLSYIIKENEISKKKEQIEPKIEKDKGMERGE